MKKSLQFCASLIAFASAQPAIAQSNDWSSSKLSRLRSWMIAAPQDALPNMPTTSLDQAIATKNAFVINLIANQEALKLAQMHLLGSSSAAKHAGWDINSEDENLDLSAFLLRSLEENDVDGYFAFLRPRPAEYAALRNAYASEAAPARRMQLAHNMERWRWMPLDIGAQYLIVNIPQYQVSYWQNGAPRGIWPVIVGKIKAPTPVFSTIVKGVTFNPWWEIPKSIVAESVGALARRNPAEAKRRGYVWANGRYRQRPGPKNSLGLMKLAMPNPFSIYLHDTPNKALFAQEVRAFSHGCIRTSDALGFASTLVEGNKSRADVDAIIAKGDTVTIPLQKTIPVYVVYFTAGIGENCNVAYYPDVYSRDGQIGDNANHAIPDPS
jgi:L,D-transpeptidase YcbB